jgi:hypothetical protein
VATTRETTRALARKSYLPLYAGEFFARAGSSGAPRGANTLPEENKWRRFRSLHVMNASLAIKTALRT